MASRGLSLKRMWRAAWMVMLAFVLLISGCARPAATTKPPEKPPETAGPGQAPQPTTPSTQPSTPSSGQTTPATPATWPPQDVLDVAWSPDSAHLAVMTVDGLRIWDINSKANWTWPVSIPQDSKLAGWRHDGLAIYLQTPENVLLEVDAKGNATPLSDPAKDGNYRFSPSPMSGAVIRAWTGKIGGKFSLIGSRGALMAWEGLFMNWAPTGRYFAYNAGQATKIVQVESGTDTALPYLATPIWQPGGEQFLLSTAKALYLMDVSGKTLATLPAVRRSTWSADGRRILFIDAEGMWTAKPDGTGKQPLTNVETGTIQSELIWLAQDELVFTTVGKTGGGGTAFYPRLIKSGNVSNLSAGSNGARPELYVSPDRRHVAYIVGPPSPDVPGDLVVYPAP